MGTILKMGRPQKYTDPKLLKRIYSLRNEGMNWEDLSQKIEKEYGLKIFRETIKSMYENYVTKAHVITAGLKKDRKESKEVMIDWNQKLEEKFLNIDRMTNKFIKFLDGLFDETSKTDNKIIALKVIPTALAVCREILAQLHFIKKQQEQIIVKQTNMIYSPLQIMNILNKQIEKGTKEGDIQIIDKRTGQVKRRLIEN